MFVVGLGSLLDEGALVQVDLGEHGSNQVYEKVGRDDLTSCHNLAEYRP